MCLIPGFGVCTAIFDIPCRWCKLNFGFLRDHVKSELNCLKSVRIRSYSGPHFPAFGLLCIQSECEKNADQNNSGYGHFLRSTREIELD